MTLPATVTVEFFGMPRQRAGRAELVVPAGTVTEVLRAVERACPGLSALVRVDGKLAPQYLLSIDGRRFASEPQEPLHPGEHVLLLSADAGG
jgi:molybdopterin converting factor small subunit